MDPIDYEETPALRLLRFLLRSFRVGTWFGIEVRIYWAALVLPFLFAQWTGLPWSGRALLLGTLQFVALFSVILSHEFAHAAMGFRHGIPCHRITLGPLGGLAHLSARPPSPSVELQVALAGPAVHLGWLLLVAPLVWLTPLDSDWYVHPLWHTLWYLKVTNLSLLGFNLLPIWPLDGGRSARALLAMRWHPNRVTLWVTAGGVCGGAVLIAMALGRPGIAGTLGVVIGVSCIAASLQERLAARHVPVYAPIVDRAAWAMDPDWWRHGGAAVREPRTGFFRRWRMERAARKAERAAAARAALDREVDAVLARVHEVGMTGLTPREKDVLKRASRARRDVG